MSTELASTIVSGAAAFLSLVGLVIGIVLLKQLLLEIRRRRELHEQELEHTRAVNRLEREQWEARKRQVQTESTHYDALAAPIAEVVATRLRTDSTWAFEALDRAKLLPFDNTIFGERSNHFKDEKSKLARELAPLLLRRLERRRSHEKIGRINLFIDSGTTLLPIFSELAGLLKVDEFDELSKVLRIVSNNLPGVTSFLRYGRENERDSDSPLVVPVHLLPGSVLPQYAAVTGPETVEALQGMLRADRAEIAPQLTVALLTGNWVRIRKTEPLCPVPLARGEGHLALKQTALEHSDEVLVVAPLGKTIINQSLDDFNNLLAYSRDPGVSGSDRAYAELNISKQKGAVVKLVTTRRAGDSMILKDHGTSMKQHLAPTASYAPAPERFINPPFGEVKGLFFPFDLQVVSVEDQCAVEFPHRRTRSRRFLEAFQVPQVHIDTLVSREFILS